MRRNAGMSAGCEASWGSRRSLAAELERRDRQVVDALRGGRQVVLWFEHDLYDQLQLLDVLSLVDESGAPLMSYTFTGH